jgi:predicted dehydrogenase
MGLTQSDAAERPGRPYRVGVIGAGWFGKLNLFTLMQVAPAEAVALADVDRRMLEEARNQTMARQDSVSPPRRRPAIYEDYRRMLEAHAFDIVIVATPDHWHALPTIAAIEKGAHVYLEKPISVDVAEGKAMVATARARERVVQVGTQRRTSPHLIEARDRIVREGRLGKIGMVEVYGYFHQRPTRFPAVSEPPAYLDWDLYCGPAPKVPFNAALHPLNWRSFTAFGNGYMGDIGVHFVDTVRWMLDLGWPRRVFSTGGVYVASESPADIPDTQIASFEFDNLLMTWTNRHWGAAPNPREQWGAIIHGDRGSLRISTGAYEFRPVNGDATRVEAQWDVAAFPQDQALRGDWERELAAMCRRNMRNFVAAIRTNGRPAADIEQGHISTASCILANMSMKLGRPLTWDAEAQRVIGDEEANALLARPYRAPLIHP